MRYAKICINILLFFPVFVSAQSDSLRVKNANKGTFEWVAKPLRAIPGLTAGSYTNLNATVDAFGRITAAANGTSGSSNWTITGSDLYRNSKISVNHTNAPNQAIDISGGIQMRYSTPAPHANGFFDLMPFNTLKSSSSGSLIGPLYAYHAGINRGLGTLVLQGASDGLGEGISFVTGIAPTERMNIGLNGSILFNTLSGTGNRLPYLNSAGQLLRGTFDPANLFSGSGTANQLAYFNGSMSITSGVNAKYDGTNLGLGNPGTVSHRLDVNAGNINIRYNNAAAPNTGTEHLTLGSYNSLPTGQTANHIFSASGSGTVLSAPIGSLFIQGYSSSDASSNIYFVTGATPSIKFAVTASGVSFPQQTGVNTHLATLSSSGAIGRTSILPSSILTAVAVNSRLTGNGTSGSPLDIAQQSATTGQYMRWNGTIWTPATLTPQSFTDAAAANNTIFYSTDRSKLCYKDPGGTVNELY